MKTHTYLLQSDDMIDSSESIDDIVCYPPDMLRAIIHTTEDIPIGIVFHVCHLDTSLIDYVVLL